MRWFETPSFNFMGYRRIAFIFSGLLILISLIGFITPGIEYGIDFKGGKEFVLEFETPVDATEVRQQLAGSLGNTPEVKQFGSEKEILIRTDHSGEINTVQNIILSSLNEQYSETNISVIKTDMVGPRFAEDLKMGALNAILFSIVVVSIYILIRFKNWTFSAGAIIALTHDVLITLGMITILRKALPFGVQVDQTIIAAFLTIVGYSLNDTVVVFDRIRENNVLHKDMDYLELMNKSLNETLSRTVITSLTTIFVIAVLFVFGGESLKGFSFSLLIGLVLGTYSSLFIASASVLEFHEKLTGKEVK
jgi:preprotein translocase SecF subunit